VVIQFPYQLIYFSLLGIAGLRKKFRKCNTLSEIGFIEGWTAVCIFVQNTTTAFIFLKGVIQIKIQ
jgi:hypothetical protein